MQDFSIVTFSVKANCYRGIKMFKTTHINMPQLQHLREKTTRKQYF